MQLALVNMVMSPWAPQNLGQFLPGSGTISFSRRCLLHGLSEWADNQTSE